MKIGPFVLDLLDLLAALTGLAVGLTWGALLR